MAMTDAAALDGKLAPPEAWVEVLVIGAGPAGLAAATALAGAGLSVLLVDENPLDPGLVGLDVPLLFGGRGGAAMASPARLLERIADSDPAIAAAVEAGVEVQLGVTCWGLYLPEAASRALPGPVAGLSDGRRCWLVGFARVVVAAGARDLVIGFDGADQPGVVGALGFDSLTRRYDAFEGQTLVIFGSGALGVGVAERALARGLTVAAMLDVTEAPRDPRATALAERGVALRLGATPVSAGRGTFGVSGCTIRTAGGVAETFACETIVLAIGLVPAIELMDAAGLAMRLDGARGGFVPVSADGVATASPLVFGAGACMGLDGETDDPGAAAAEGRRAAHAVLASLGRGAPASVPGSATRPPDPGADPLAYRQRVLAALLATGGAEVPVCACEGVSRADLLALRAPRYLGPPTPQSLARDLARHAAGLPPSHDQIKRLTRATMGPCQGRRCREQVALLLAIGSGQPAGAIGLAGHRAPVRPLPLAALASLPETPAMADAWPVWFGIPTQWIPYDAIGTAQEQALIASHMHL